MADGFGGFNTRRIEDRYGDVYDVPSDLFDGYDDIMARQYVERARAEKIRPKNPYGTTIDFLNDPVPSPDRFPDKPETYREKPWIERLAGDYLPHKEEFKYGLEGFGRTLLGLGKMITTPPMQQAVEYGQNIGVQRGVNEALERAKDPRAEPVENMLLKEGLGAISPIPIEPAWRMAKGFGYGLGLTNTPVTPRDFAEATGEMIPATALSALGAKHARTVRNRLPGMGRENPLLMDDSSPHGEVSNIPPWLDPEVRQGVMGELDIYGNPIPIPEPTSTTYVAGGEPGATSRIYPDILPQQPAAGTALAAAMRMNENPEQVLYPREGEPTGFQQYLQRDAAIQEQVSRPQRLADERFRRFMEPSAPEPYAPAMPDTASLGINARTRGQQPSNIAPKRELTPAELKLPKKKRAEIQQQIDTEYAQYLESMYIPEVPPGPVGPLYQTIPTSLWPRTVQTAIEGMVPSRFRAETPAIPEPTTLNIGTLPRPVGEPAVRTPGPLASGGQVSLEGVREIPLEIPGVESPVRTAQPSANRISEIMREYGISEEAAVAVAEAEIATAGQAPPIRTTITDPGLPPMPEILQSPTPYDPVLTQEHFTNIGDAQRGAPEAAMLKAANAMGGGVMQPIIEHLGDLTHRMYDSNTFKNAGYEFVKDKVDKVLKWMTNPYGLEREFGENLKNNADYYKQDPAAYTENVKAAMENYANEHSKLPVYNEAGRLARDAAVALGRGDFATAISYLQELKAHMGTPEEWKAYAHEGLGQQHPDIAEPSLRSTIRQPEPLGAVSEFPGPALEGPPRAQGPSQIGARTPEPTPYNPDYEIKSVIDEASASPDKRTRDAAEYSASRLAQIKKEGFVERQKTKFSNARELMREFLTESDEAALTRFGQAGNDLRLTAQQATADSYAFSGKQTAALEAAIREIPRAKRTAFLEEAIGHIEKGTNSTNPAIKNLVDAYRANDVVGNALYTESGMQIKNLKGETVPYAPREKYWPHKYPEGFEVGNENAVLQELLGEGLTLNQAKKVLSESKRQGYGFLDELHQRRGNLPGYRKDIDVAKGHYIDMARKAFNDKTFGQLEDKASFVRQKIEQIRAEFGDDAAYKVEGIMSRYLGKDVYNTRFEGAANLATGFEAFSKLGASTLRNIPGGMAMTFARTEFIPYVKALWQSFNKEGRQIAHEMGVLGSLFRDSAKDVGYGSKPGKLYGINFAERYLRTFAGLAGKNEAQVLFNRAKAGNAGKSTIKQLQDLILEPDIESVLGQESLTQSQIDRAANRMVDLTQGRADSMNLPHAWSTPNPTANVLTQFKKYAFIQSKNMKDALKANPAMVLRLAPFMVMFGEASADLRSLISGKPRPEGMERIIDDISSAFGLGMASDVFTAFRQGTAGEAMGRLAPPIASDLFKVGAAVFSDNPWERTTEELVGLTPIVGSRLRSELKESRK